MRSKDTPPLGIEEGVDELEHWSRKAGQAFQRPPPSWNWNAVPEVSTCPKWYQQSGRMAKAFLLEVLCTADKQCYEYPPNPMLPTITSEASWRT
jgi:hypothetical protein